MNAVERVRQLSLPIAGVGGVGGQTSVVPSLRALQASTHLLDEPAQLVASLDHTPVCTPGNLADGVADTGCRNRRPRLELLLALPGELLDLLPEGSW